MPSLLLGSQPLLGPLVGLVSWTFVMEAWMYAYRIPDMGKYKVDNDPNKIADELKTKLPKERQRPADNYNHLHEQPTLFYAIALALNQLGVKDQLTVNLAWTYVGLRIVHSLVQATSNPIMIRFSIFAGSSLVLLSLAAKAGLTLWN